MKTVIVYESEDGEKPFEDWYSSLDYKTKIKVTNRIDRLALGNAGDCKTLKNAKGIKELRIHHGAGYRVYFKGDGQTIILLLCGSTKANQRGMVKRAIKYWEDYKK